MKLTEKQLRQVLNRELEKILNEWPYPSNISEDANEEESVEEALSDWFGTGKKMKKAVAASEEEATTADNKYVDNLMDRHRVVDIIGDRIDKYNEFMILIKKIVEWVRMDPKQEVTLLRKVVSDIAADVEEKNKEGEGKEGEGEGKEESEYVKKHRAKNAATQEKGKQSQIKHYGRSLTDKPESAPPKSDPTRQKYNPRPVTRRTTRTTQGNRWGLEENKERKNETKHNK